MVVGNPAATVITSSPGLIALSLSLGEVRVEKAIKFAEDPELTVINCLIPINFASFFSLASEAASRAREACEVKP